MLFLRRITAFETEHGMRGLSSILFYLPSRFDSQSIYLRKDQIMKSLYQLAKLIATIVIGLTFSGLVMAADEMGKDNNMGSDRDAGMNRDKGASNHRMHENMKRRATRDYNTAVANCKTIERADRRNCMKEAKATRQEAMRNAR